MLLINIFHVIYSSAHLFRSYTKHVQALQCLKWEKDLILFILVDYCRICYHMIQSKKIIWQSRSSHGHCCMMLTYFIYSCSFQPIWLCFIVSSVWWAFFSLMILPFKKWTDNKVKVKMDVCIQSGISLVNTRHHLFFHSIVLSLSYFLVTTNF